MILSSIFGGFLGILKLLLDGFDFAFPLPSWSVNSINMILKALSFFPFEVWSVLISNILFWILIHIGWAIIEWIYKKIPGVS